MKLAKKPGSLGDARLKVWRALMAAERAMNRAEAAEDTDRVLRAVHAISQTSMTYAKLFEVTELNDRVDALEQSQGLRRVS